MEKPVSDKWKDDSLAEKLEGTKWDYTQSDDRRFLLDPIGQIFSTFCWDGDPKPVIRRIPKGGGDETED
jgi:hypothetical protein